MLLLALLVLSVSIEHLDEFTTDVFQDELAYTSIAIPRHSRRLYIKVAIESAVQED